MVADDSSAPAEMTIAIEVSRFDADIGGRVALDASWETMDKNGKLVGVLREAKIVESGTSSDAAAVAATMSPPSTLRPRWVENCDSATCDWSPGSPRTQVSGMLRSRVSPNGNQIIKAKFGEIVEIPGLQPVNHRLQNFCDPAAKIPNQLVFLKSPATHHLGSMVMNKLVHQFVFLLPMDRVFRSVR
jgi:hypothetical protein